MFTVNFWKQAAERAVKSAAQSVVLLAGADQFNVLEFHWTTAGGVAAGAAVLSVLTSVVSLPFGERNDPSLATKTAA